MEKLLKESGSLKSIKEASGEGKDSLGKRKMHPIKAYVRGGTASPMGDVGHEQKELSLLQVDLTILLGKKDLPSGHVDDLVGFFHPFGVDPLSLVLEETRIVKANVGIDQKVHVGFAYLMLVFRN
jgi:hypothetical protein